MCTRSAEGVDDVGASHLRRKVQGRAAAKAVGRVRVGPTRTTTAGGVLGGREKQLRHHVGVPHCRCYHEGSDARPAGRLRRCPGIEQQAHAALRSRSRSEEKRGAATRGRRLVDVANAAARRGVVEQCAQPVGVAARRQRVQPACGALQRGHNRERDHQPCGIDDAGQTGLVVMPCLGFGQRHGLERGLASIGEPRLVRLHNCFVGMGHVWHELRRRSDCDGR